MAMNVPMASLCDRVMIDERGAVTLLGLLNERSIDSGDSLSFATYFEIEIERQPDPREWQAHFDLIGPDGNITRSESINFTDGINDQDPSLCTFSTRFDLSNFPGRGPHDVALVVDGVTVAVRRLEVTARP